jgi:integrase
MRTSWQKGSVVRVHQKSGDIWRLRYRLDGIQRSDYIGTIKQHPTKASAEKAAEKMRSIINFTPTEIITVGNLIDKYEREAMPEREATAASYKSIFRRIRERWGDVRLDQFSLDMVAVEDWLKDLKVVGRHPKPGVKPPVSPLFRAQVKNIFHTLIEHGMKWGALQTQRNPLELVRLKGNARAKEIVILSLDQYQALLDDPQLPETVKVMAQLAAGLGLRVSEILGLKWEDFSFESKTIHIQRSVVHGKANDTKSKTSAATLPLHENLIEILRGWKAHEALKSRWVFCSERTGRPLDRDWLRSEYLQPAGERIGVPGLGFHSLRHLYRALLRKMDTPLEIQKNLLRHSKLATTIDIYGGKDDAERLRPENSKIVEFLSQRATA